MADTDPPAAAAPSEPTADAPVGQGAGQDAGDKGLLKRRSASRSRSRSPPRRRRRSRSRSRSRSGSGGRRRRHHRSRRRRRSRSRSRSPKRRHRRRSGSRSASPGYGYSRSNDRRKYRGERRYRDFDYRQYDRRGRPRNSRRAQRADRSPSSESAKAEAHTRDARTIFVSQLVRRATERDIRKYFEQVGKVRKVELITDRGGASKGIAYVEFKKLESVPAACLLNGRQFCTKHTACTCSGFPILVKDSEAHKNHLYRAQQDAKAANEAAAANGGENMTISTINPAPNTTPHPLMGMVTGMNPTAVPGGAAGGAVNPLATVGMAMNNISGSSVPMACRIHVGNLANGTTEAELAAIFSSFGDVVSTSVRMEPGRPTGYGFVHFRTEQAAQMALRSGGGIELRGLAIKVNYVNEPTQQVSQDWKLDDVEAGGVSLNSSQRVALMRKLAGDRGVGQPSVPTPPSASVPPAAAAAAAPVAPAAPSALAGEPCPCFIVRNMFDPAQETEAHWDRDIEDEVAEEMAKYGDLVHIFVDKHSAGHVYMMFKTTEQGGKAANVLHGRFFAQRRLTCEFIPTSKYLQKFPDAKK